MSVVDHAPPHRLLFKTHNMFIFHLYLFLNQKYTWLCYIFDKYTEINKKLQHMPFPAILSLLANQQSRFTGMFFLL